MGASRGSSTERPPRKGRLVSPARSKGKDTGQTEGMLKRMGLETRPPLSPNADKVVRAIGRATFLDYAREAKHEGVIKMIEVYDGLSPRDKSRAKITDLCGAGGLSFAELLGEVAAISFTQSADLSTLIAAVNHPKVVQATVKHAMKFEGDKDREMLHKHANFIPTPKGSNTIVQFRNNINNLPNLPAPDTGELPTFEFDTVELGKNMQSKLLLAQENES